MLGFIQLKKFNITTLLEGEVISVAVHTIGSLVPMEAKGKDYTAVSLSFGASGKVIHNVVESYATILALIDDARPAGYKERDELVQEIIRLQHELIAAKDETIALLRGGLNRPN